MTDRSWPGAGVSEVHRRLTLAGEVIAPAVSFLAPIVFTLPAMRHLDCKIVFGWVHSHATKNGTPPNATPGVASVYKFMPSVSCAAASIFALPRTMASLALSPRIQQSSMSAHTCMRTRRGPDKRAWL